MPQPPKRADGKATMERLLDQAVIELDKHGEAKFDLEAVLERSNSARSSLYHHFVNKEGLIAAANVRKIVSGFNEDNKAFRAAVEYCTSPEQFFELIESVMRATPGATTAPLRAQRIQLLSSAQHNAIVAAAIRDAQESGTKFYAETIQLGIERGLFAPRIDLQAIAFWIQGQFLGRVSLDLGDVAHLDNEWVSASLAGIKAVLNPSVN